MISPKSSPRPVVLIVEDEPLILFMMQDVLEDAGFEAIVSRNADDALDILRGRQDIAAVFTDIDMPGSMNGVKLAALVSERWPHIAIMITSGHIRSEHGALPPRAVFFAKPYDIGEVTGRLAQLLASRGSDPHAEPAQQAIPRLSTRPLHGN